MYDRIKKLLSPSVEGDRTEALSATLLNTALLTMVGVTLLIPPLIVLFDPTGQENLLSLFLGWTMAAVMSALWYVMRRGRVELVSYLFSFTFLAVLTAVTFLFGGIRNTSTVGFALVIIMAILLLRSRRASLLFTALTISILAFAYVAELQGIIEPQPPRGVSTVDFIIYAAVFALTGSLLHFAVRNLNDALERAQASEQAAAQANQQLQGLNAELEDRVSARTQALVTSAEISRTVATILDKEELVRTVAQEIRNAFNYYQVHLYLLNAARDTLELAAGAGHAGVELVRKRHRVPVDRGLVGRAVRTNQPVLAPDVSQVDFWLPNPLLPDTQSEITVPIALGGNVLGVLDIQQNVRNGLGQNDADLLLSISGQVAVALENARLLAEARGQAEQEALINQISQQIQSTITMEQAMQVAVREVGRTVNAPQTRVRLVSGQKSVADPGNGRALQSETAP
ncbi:MAG: GAF domain-containing protein [Anaerolineae bacterium]|nr:GAF domain-containing protein [Anaerolineae bacterium]